MDQKETGSGFSQEQNAEAGALAAGGEARCSSKGLRMLAIGVGRAGRNCMSALACEGMHGMDFVALTTDIGPLKVDLAPRVTHHQIGSATMRGLGTGGDPEAGRSAAESSVDQVRSICQGRDVVFVIGGMGGGTGTGAAPVVARLAKEAGALVLGVVTLPFDFEGARRRRQAAWGVEQLKAAADAVICLPNETLLGLAGVDGPVLEVFRIINGVVADGVRSTWRVLSRPGIMHVDFADFCGVMKGRHAESLMASALAGGENRAVEAAQQLMSSPFLQGGQALRDADAILVSFVGGARLSIAEINRVMEPIQEHGGMAHLFVGASVDPDFEDQIAVTLMASKGGRLGIVAGRSGSGIDGVGTDEAAGDADWQGANPSGVERHDSARSPVPSSVALSSGTRAEIPKMQENPNGVARPTGRRLRQGMLPLEIVSRGRFDKSEPTIHKGEDLDVPTYIRRGISLN